MQLVKSIRARRARGSRGQALVELALIVPIMAVLFLATIDLGRVFYSQITITNAAREAAMKAAEDPTSYTAGTCNATTSKVVCAAINEARNSFVTVSAADVSMSCTPACTKSYGNRATVTVLGHFNLLTPLMSAFTGGSNITLKSTASADVVVVPAVAVATPTPSPTPTPVATPTPTPVGTPTPTPTPTPVATPTPTPIPCAPPYAAFTYSQQNKNKPVVFTSTSTPTSGSCQILYWRWDFGDGVLSTGNPTTISHTYATQGGTYTVALTVTVTGGVTTTTYVTITTAG
jgi:Flp pilus assembly protein TadG